MITWILKLLRSFCPPHLLEEIEGDLLQRFGRDVKLHGERKAKRRLLWNAIRFFRPGILLRNKFSNRHNPLPMFKNYFITSLRHIGKSKVNFAFKIGGLSLAIFSFLAIAVYVSHQFSFDAYHSENIYRVNSQRKENGVVEKYASAPLAIGPMLKQYLPEVETFARTRFAHGSYLRFDDKAIECGGLLEADSTLFEVLTFHFIVGNKNALNDPDGIVLIRTKALELFGDTDVLHRVVTINHNPQPYKVTAVVEDPRTSCFGFEAIILNRSEHKFSLQSVVSPVEFLDEAATTFARLKQPPSSAFESKVESLIDRFIKKSDRIETGFALSFQPIKDIYLSPQLKGEFARKGSPVYVYAFSILGVLLLVVAAINYINLSIADFNSRARETSVRKVFGARKHQLVTQVVLETLLFSVLALVIAFTMLYIFFPKVMQLLDSDLRLSMLLDKKLIIGVSIGLVSLIFLSALFPARLFTRGGIADNLKSGSNGYKSSVSQVLLCAQFSISAICIACTLVAGQQVDFIHHKDLGIDRNNLMVFNVTEDFPVGQMITLKQRLQQIPGVKSVSNTSFRIGGGYWKDWYFVESDNGFKNLELYEVFSDDDVFETLGINLLEGRTFNAQMPADSGAAFVINETAARELGWSNPIGKRIYTHPEEKGKWDGTVVGVVKDINISPLYEQVRPLVMRLPWQNQYPDFFVYVRYEGDPATIIRDLGKVYNENNPGYPFTFRFVDEFYNSEHQKENRAFASLQFSTGIIVLVSMLGIFSMAAFISVKRMKEFGIRKVLGASVRQIAGLHIGYFMRLVLISNIIALPIAYFVVKEWLNTFAYRIDLSYLPFIIVIIVSVLLVILSGGYSAWKSGRMNPVDVIKIN